MFSNGEVKGSTSTFNPSSKSWRRAVSASWLQATAVINEVVRKGACGHITVTWFVRFGNWVKTGRSDVDYEEDSGYWGTSILGILLLYFFPAFHDCLVLLSVPSCLTVQGVFHPCPPKQAALWHAERTVRFPPKKRHLSFYARDQWSRPQSSKNYFECTAENWTHFTFSVCLSWKCWYSLHVLERVD